MNAQDLLDLIRERYPGQDFYLVVKETEDDDPVWIDPCDIELTEDDEIAVMKNLNKGAFDGSRPDDKESLFA